MHWWSWPMTGRGCKAAMPGHQVDKRSTQKGLAPGKSHLPTPSPINTGVIAAAHHR